MALLDGQRGWPFVLERFDESSQGLCDALARRAWGGPSGQAPACGTLPRVVSPVVGGGGRKAGMGRELRPEDVRHDAKLAPEVFANEFLDFRSL